MSALWDNNFTQGSTPHSREGATACLINGKIYMFGGFARDVYSDLRVLDRSENKWTLVNSNQPRHELP